MNAKGPQGLRPFRPLIHRVTTLNLLLGAEYLIPSLGDANDSIYFML